MTGALLCAVALLPLSGAAAQESGAEPAEVTVSMNHFEFAPAEVEVPAGATVTWTYDADGMDPQPNCESPQFRVTDACPGHSTTASDTGPDGAPLWDSGVHRADGFPFSHTFDRPGTYDYYCTIHGGDSPNNPLTAMNGRIVVVAASADGDAAGEPTVPADDQPAQLPLTGAAWPALGAVLVLATLARGRRAA